MKKITINGSHGVVAFNKFYILGCFGYWTTILYYTLPTYMFIGETLYESHKEEDVSRIKVFPEQIHVRMWASSCYYYYYYYYYYYFMFNFGGLDRWGLGGEVQNNSRILQIFN
jgi:hypothetical protein